MRTASARIHQLLLRGAVLLVPMLLVAFVAGGAICATAGGAAEPAKVVFALLGTPATGDVDPGVIVGGVATAGAACTAGAIVGALVAEGRAVVGASAGVGATCTAGASVGALDTPGPGTAVVTAGAADAVVGATVVKTAGVAAAVTTGAVTVVAAGTAAGAMSAAVVGIVTLVGGVATAMMPPAAGANCAGACACGAKALRITSLGGCGGALREDTVAPEVSMTMASVLESAGECSYKSMRVSPELPISIAAAMGL